VNEHNLDVIADTDWISDLGPEGDDPGGRIVAQESPEAVVRVKSGSHTANVLREFLAERSRQRTSPCYRAAGTSSLSDGFVPPPVPEIPARSGTASAPWL